MSFQKTYLPNGIGVVSEDYPSSRSVSLGVWVDTGARDELPQLEGVSHFLEHMLFKGTRRRSAYQIVKDLERVGGEINAFTTKEHTCLHTFGLYEDIELAADVLSDLIARATFPKFEFNIEKEVVIQEIRSAEDAAEEYAFDIFLEKFYKGSSLSHQILGTEISIANLSRSELVQYYKERYVGRNIIVSAAGRLNHEELVRLVKKNMGRLPEGQPRPPRKKARSRLFREVLARDSEQTHVVMGFPVSSLKGKYRYEPFVLNALLGGGMSSRLYQKVREEQGLAYSIYSANSIFNDVGLINIYGSTSASQVKKMVKLIFSELLRIRKKGFTASDLELFRNQVRAGVLMGADDMDTRMHAIGLNESIFKKYKTVDQIVKEIEMVSVDSLSEYVSKYLLPEKMSVLCYGAHTSGDVKWLKGL